MTDPKALIAEARETFGGHTAQEVAELLDALAASADRCEANSYSEIASISLRGSAAIRRLAAALEEATVPEGWRVTEYVKGSEYAANAARTWSATPGKWWLHGDHREFPTAREAMAALDTQKAPPLKLK